MSNLLSVRDLLINHQILGNSSEKKERHAAYEFQAFAYKLAADLNDLEHLKIYMKLCKAVPKTIIERAYTYAVDANKPQKGRIFLWKVKALRKEIIVKKALTTFDYDFVIKHLKTLREKYAGVLAEKQEEAFSDEHKNMFHGILASFQTKKSVKHKVLLIGTGNRILITNILKYKFNILGIDVSKSLNKIVTNFLEVTNEDIKYKFVAKDFLANSYKTECTSLVIINRFWSQIPSEIETKYILEIKRILKPGGKLIFDFKEDVRDSQDWKSYTINQDETYILEKKNNPINLIAKFEAAGFGLKIKYSFNNKENYLLLEKQ